MPFPFAKNSPVTVYDMLRPGGEPLYAFEIAQLRDQVADTFVSSRVPPSLDSSDEYTWGWAWFDDKGPIHCGGWVAWLVRAWVKKPPKSLLEAMVDQAVEKHMLANPGFKITPEWRDGEREDIAKTLRIRQPPKIEEVSVAIDTVNNKLLLFTANARVRDGMVARLRTILAPMLGDGLMFQAWTLETYLATTRPKAVLPIGVGPRWATWLSTQALHRQSLEATVNNRVEPIRLSVELDASIRIATEDGVTSVSGTKAVESAVQAVDEGDDGASTSRVTIYLRVKDGHDYGLTIDTAGHIVRCRLAGASTISSKVDNLELAVLSRCDDFMQAAKLVQVLFGAFDFGPLTTWMEAQPQRQLFPGTPTGLFVWTDTPDEENEAKKEDDPSVVRLFSADDSQQVAKLCRPMIQGDEGLARVVAAGFDVKAFKAFLAHDDNIEVLVAWYVDGGWPRLLVGLAERGVKKANVGASTRRRTAEDAAPVDYLRSWDDLLVDWRDEVGGARGFNLNEARKKTEAQAARRKLVDAHRAGGWDLVATTLVAMGVPLKKGHQ